MSSNTILQNWSVNRTLIQISILLGMSCYRSEKWEDASIGVFGASVKGRNRGGFSQVLATNLFHEVEKLHSICRWEKP